MTLTWTKEDSPRWDADKQRLFGPAELAAVGLAAPVPGAPVADEWWRVTDGHEVAGYGCWTPNGATRGSRSSSRRAVAAGVSASSSWSTSRPRPPRAD